VTQEASLGKNPRKYPELERSRVQAGDEIKREREAPQTKLSIRLSVKKITTKGTKSHNAQKNFV